MKLQSHEFEKCKLFRCFQRCYDCMNEIVNEAKKTNADIFNVSFL